MLCAGFDILGTIISGCWPFGGSDSHSEQCRELLCSEFLCAIESEIKMFAKEIKPSEECVHRSKNLRDKLNLWGHGCHECFRVHYIYMFVLA